MIDAAKWQRSSFCADSACVEVAELGEEVVGLRSNLHLEVAPLIISKNAWNDLLDRITHGDLAAL